MQATYRPYKRVCTSFFMYIRYLTSLILLYFDTCANQLLSSFRLKYFSAYVHTDVVVKYSYMSNMHEDVKFKFIRLFSATIQKLDMNVMYVKKIL
jgi:hypothetical protein